MNCDKDKFLVPVASCKFVAGARRALAVDLQRSTFKPVPLHLKYLVDTYSGRQLRAAYADFDEDQHATLNEYFAFLLQEEFIFLSSHAEEAVRFTDLPTDVPALAPLDNAIIDIGPDTRYDIAATIRELLALGCGQLQVRAYRSMPVSELTMLAALTEGSECRNIEFIVPFIPAFKTTDWAPLLTAHLRIGGIVCHGAPENGTDWYLSNLVPVHYVTETIRSEHHCGIVHPRYFAANQPHFLESLHHNTCLYRKIAVDQHGYIKNCPSMREHFGLVGDVALRDALFREAFRAQWHISKDTINTCRDCEYRRVCTDCRAYLSDPGDERSKPLKCGYDPYTATWADWAESPLKQAAITFYDLKTSEACGKVPQ